MKKIPILFFTLFTLSSFAQTFYQDIGDEDYQNLMKNGLSYVLTGNVYRDSVIKKALTEQWNVSPHKIVDPAKGESLSEGDVEIRLLAEEGVPLALNLTLVSVKTLKKKGFSIYSTTATANITGFTGVVSGKSMHYFIPYLVGAFNDMATKMNAQKIEQRGSAYFNTMHALYLPNAKVLKEKTLLLVDRENTIINENELKKAGIKYEFVNFKRFLELEKDSPENYCLLYLNPGMFSDITIFNLADKSIAYTRHYIKNVPKLDKDDIKAIVSSWN